MNKYRITVDKHFQPIPQAHVAGNQIQQVLLNLISNAAKFTETGTVTLSAKKQDDQILFSSFGCRDFSCRSDSL